MTDERVCPVCGGPISTSGGMGWQDASGQVQSWVGTCISCNMSSGEEPTFGIDASDGLIPVMAFMLDDDLGF